MWIYLGLLLAPLVSAMASGRNSRTQSAAYWTMGLALVLAIGLRHQVGCDWNPYQYMFVRAQSGSLPDALTFCTWGYMLLNWLVAKLGLGVAGVYLVCAAVLVGGVFAFCRAQPNPWIAFLVCVPILLLLAGFNATRQSVAVGIFLYCLALYQGQRRGGAILPLMVVAGSFHTSAFLMLFLFVAMHVRWWRLSPMATILLAGAGGLALALAATMLGLSDRFPTAAGAWFRIIPTLLALAALPLVWRLVKLNEIERRMVTWLAAFALFCVALGLFSSMVMDRLNYYAVPLQIMVFCRLATLARTPFHRAALNSIIAAPFLILCVAWLAFTTSRSCMLPYRSYLSEPSLILGTEASTDYQLDFDPDSWGWDRPPAQWPPPAPAPGTRYVDTQ
jgi:hypothetical protein